MSTGDVIAVAAILVTVVIASVGGTAKLMQARLKDRDRKIELLEQAADKQDDVIAELRSQRDKLQITAELQDKFFGDLGKLSPKRGRE